MMKIFLILFSPALLSCWNKQKEISKVEFSDNRIDTKDLILLNKINCTQESNETINYNLNCKNFNVSNTLIEGSDINKYELITFIFNDIEKAIIRKINNEDLETSSPLIYYSDTSKNYVIFFPVNGDHHFGWKLYLYKNKVLYPVGQRIMYWKPEYEESDISYSDILNIYEGNDNIVVEIPAKKAIIALRPAMFPEVAIRTNRFIFVQDPDTGEPEFINPDLFYHFNTYIFHNPKYKEIKE
ncbi:hypothetical protein DRF59_17345 [Chryseobacterium flavum]|uniref:Lipoprotein n=1 Tax=Chryseobacterium flavum TaxID=415851 RepID=A0A3D9CHM6_9FLAO|nr:hypothetical protein [Chryseobacterium flavum]REC65216.1 hypothetical protein DRF59_17345 [Chryseobacterium flavum]